MNPLVQLHSKKQSFWLDYIRRRLMTSGDLKKMLREDGLRGMTSNPTIFQKAISAGDEYDQTIKKLAKKIECEEQLFEALAIEDIQKAADILKPVYKSSQGEDGFISLEVSPNLAFDTQGTLAAAKRLSKKVNRPNLMIKIPGTLEGLPAIEEAIFAGININITLLFSVEIYKKVVAAYIKGLERRVKKGLPIRKIASVASFFVSRVDVLIDKQIEKIISEGGSHGQQASQILHKIAIANAKVAYEYYETVFNSPRFKKLRKKGAQDQRLLWASTGTKDKRLSDVFYIEELIGPNTVNTIPPATAEAFKDHGTVEVKLNVGVAQAKKDLESLADLGISIEKATDKLQKDGVKSFINSFDELLTVVAAKKELLLGNHDQKMKLSLGNLTNAFDEQVEKMEDENWIKRIWSKDASLWKTNEAHQKIITNSLGWLTVARIVKNNFSLLEEIQKSVIKAKFTHVLLLGMGGSSLCPEVLSLTFGRKKGFPEFSILDSTQPASVIERASRSKPEKTLYIVASKSGSTTEPNAFLSYFFDQVKKKKGAKAGDNFIAITDPGTLMEDLAKKKKFRKIILNPPDIGGRYSALSFFGMVPAAVMGLPFQKVINRAIGMSGACSLWTPLQKNPGAILGAALGVAAKAGRNKLTLFISKEIETFGTWVEQLVAESTGKEDTGILPVESEEIQGPEAYSSDRIFVSIRTGKNNNKRFGPKLKKLEKAGHPVIEILVDGKNNIGAEFFRWEMATAVTGAILGINPFDQPNVQEAKELTKSMISDYKSSGQLPEESPVFEDDKVIVYAVSHGNGNFQTFKDVIQHFLAQIGPQDYVALLAYMLRNKVNESYLQDVRHKILKEKKVATTVGFGPRYLHSTGQYHKGGDNHGLFISITSEDQHDLSIPGEPFTYHVLKEAQAWGDKAALRNKSRRLIHIHLKDSKKGLKWLNESIQQLSFN